MQFLQNEAEQEQVGREWALVWSGYCAFHLGDYRRALDAYRRLPDLQDAHLNMAVCYFYLGQYTKTSANVSYIGKT